MTTALTGDFSKYPASIRGLFPHLAGETLQLREAWVVYAHLFMEKKEFTDIMAERLGDAILPRVAFKEIRILLELIEAFLNVFSREFDDTTIRYDVISGHEITGKAESTVYAL